MSDGNGDRAPGNTASDDQEVLATTGRAARRGSFGPGGGAGMPAERSEDFGATVRRLGTILGNETRRLVGVVALTVASVTLVVLGPRLLGQATDIIVSGVLGRRHRLRRAAPQAAARRRALPGVVVPRVLPGLHPRRGAPALDVRAA